MRNLILCGLALATASAASAAKDVESSNYEALVKKHKTVLIDFWAPWCDHCKNLEPEFDAAADRLDEKGVVLAKMNIDNKGNRAVAQKVGVQGYPGLIIFTDGKINKRATAHISRIRDADFLTLFMSKVHADEEFPKDPEVDDAQFTKNTKKKKTKHKKNSPSPTPKAKASNDKVLQITSKSRFNKALNQNDIVLVMFFAPWCGHCKKMKPSFAEASTILAKEDVALAQVDATALKDLAKEHEVSSYPTLKIFFEGAFAEEYEGGRSTDELVSYMRNYAASQGEGATPQDACLTVNYCVKHYGDCCANGNWKKGDGRKAVCKQAKTKL